MSSSERETFKLIGYREGRIGRLRSAGINSLAELASVLAALDLRAVVQIQEVDVRAQAAQAVESEGQP